jgi:membrane protease YdiL (CAAX protease family)
LPISVGIVLVVLSYTWLIEPIAPRWVRHVPTVAVMGLAVWRAVKTGEWGLARSEFVPALRWAFVLTAMAVAATGLAGWCLGTWHHRHDIWGTLVALIPWGVGQQFALQTVLLREAQAAMSPRKAIGVAALVFSALHLPNPALALLTFLGALGWCWIYDRHPNVIPLGLSHAIATLAMLYALDDHITGRLRVGRAYLMLFKN